MSEANSRPSTLQAKLLFRPSQDTQRVVHFLTPTLQALLLGNTSLVAKLRKNNTNYWGGGDNYVVNIQGMLHILQKAVYTHF